MNAGLDAIPLEKGKAQPTNRFGLFLCLDGYGGDSNTNNNNQGQGRQTQGGGGSMGLVSDFSVFFLSSLLHLAFFSFRFFTPCRPLQSLLPSAASYLALSYN